MDSLRLVAPISYSNENNSLLLSLLKNYFPSHPLDISSDTLIPVKSGLDVDGIIRHNNKRTPRGHNQMTSENHSDSIEVDAEEVVEDGDDTDPENWRSFDLFNPRNRLEQMNTVLLQDFPRLKKQAIVICLDLFLSLNSLKTSKNYVFSFISETIGRDGRGVFVRFLSLDVTQWVKRNVHVIFPNVIAAFDEEVDATFSKELLPAELNGVDTEIHKVCANTRNYSGRSKLTGTEDLDEVMKYYRTYKVENSELVEVPKELKEVIVKDILKFRSKMLMIERQRREQEIENERRRARNRLILIYEGIKAAPVGSEAEEMDTDEEQPMADPLDKLTDAEYEEHIAKEKSLEDEALWSAQLQEIERLEALEKTPMVRKLQKELAYEESLVENKIIYMDETKELAEMDFTVAATTPIGNSTAQLYYTNNAEYLRIRNQSRAHEEEMDAVDEKIELEENPEPSKAVRFAASKVSKENNSEEDEKKNEKKLSQSIVILASFPAKKLKALKDKISSLVEEYLGIKEELLIEFIYDFMMEKNTEAREELVTELQETLDEDSNTVVDELHSYIRSL